MALKATEVFVPGAFPRHTYVERSAESIEQALKDALDTPGQIISLAGPSKSGKTVLVEKVVGLDRLISISGASLKSEADIWARVLDWMDLPNSTSRSRRQLDTTTGKASGTLGGGVLGFAKAEGTMALEGARAREESSQEVYNRGGLEQVVQEIAESDFVILVDDFHYMDRDLQVSAAKSLKEAVRRGLKIVTASVPHRNDDVVRANPELRGRVKAVDLGYWVSSDLQKIATTGFDLLNVVIPSAAIEQFVSESAGSPQLMQMLCLQACFVLNTREKTLLRTNPKVDGDILKNIFQQASANTNYLSMVDVLDSGPRTRGVERKTYKCTNGGSGDVYNVVLRAVAMDPPKLSFSYDELLKRTEQVCIGESPVGSSVTGTCHHMAKLAQEKFVSERAIEWDEQKQVLDIPDPYLLFYLRWSDRLTRN